MGVPKPQKRSFVPPITYFAVGPPYQGNTPKSAIAGGDHVQRVLQGHLRQLFRYRSACRHRARARRLTAPEKRTARTRTPGAR